MSWAYDINISVCVCPFVCLSGSWCLLLPICVLLCICSSLFHLCYLWMRQVLFFCLWCPCTVRLNVFRPFKWMPQNVFCCVRVCYFSHRIVADSCYMLDDWMVIMSVKCAYYFHCILPHHYSRVSLLSYQAAYIFRIQYEGEVGTLQHLLQCFLGTESVVWDPSICIIITFCSASQNSHCFIIYGTVDRVGFGTYKMMTRVNYQPICSWCLVECLLAFHAMVSTKEVMFLPQFVGLSVSWITREGVDEFRWSVLEGGSSRDEKHLISCWHDLYVCMLALVSHASCLTFDSLAGGLHCLNAFYWQ